MHIDPRQSSHIPSFQNIEEIINPIINGSCKDMGSSQKEDLKNKIIEAFGSNFEHLSSLYENQEKSKINNKVNIKSIEKEIKQPTNIMETVEDYEPLLKEFENVKLEELFESNPRIETIAKAYMEEKNKAEFFKALMNNPGSFAGFLIGLQLMNHQIEEGNKELFHVFGDLDVEGLLEENPLIEKIARKHRDEETISDKINDIAGVVLEFTSDKIDNIAGFVLDSTPEDLQEGPMSDTANEIQRKTGDIELESIVPKPVQAALLSTFCGLQALKQGKYKLATAHMVGIVSIAFCSFYDPLLKDATLATIPNAGVGYDIMKSMKKLKDG